MRSFSVSACVALWCMFAWAMASHAQAPTAEGLYAASPLALTGGRASSLGGSLVSRADDNSTAWWNPAGTGGLPRMTFMGANLGVTSPNRGQLRGVYQALTATDPTDPSMDDLEAFIDFAQGLPRDSGGVARPISLGAAASAFANAGNVGLFAVSVGTTTMSYDARDQIRAGRREVHLESTFGALAVVEAGVAYSKRAGELDFGVAAKDIEGYYVGATSSLDIVDTDLRDGFDDNDTTITETRPTASQEGRARAFGVDLGMLKRNGDRTQLGVVVRNINRPVLRFTDSAGVVVGRLRLRPRLDAGIVAELDRHVSLSADMHNLTFANGNGPSLHLGLQLRVAGSSSLRLGVNRGIPSLGLGFRAGGLNVDGAVGMGETPFASLGAHLSF